MRVVLRLNSTAVQTLADNGHLPGWPHDVNPNLVRSDDADAPLNRAAARWYQTADRRQVGKGSIYLGAAEPEDAVEILEYLDGLAGALFCSPDADVRKEARRISVAVSQAVAYLRRSGVPVWIVQRDHGLAPFYRIGEDQS